LDGRWLDFELVVESTGTRPLAGEVHFYLHDSFARPHYRRAVKNGQARLKLRSFGAFTAGAVADEGRTELELDLSLQSGLPLSWRQR
jgi:hypothetical protein